MAKALHQLSPTAKSPDRSPLVVEFLGPAGSGKTTLIRTLSNRYPQVKASVTPRLIDYVPFFARDSSLLFPFLHNGYRNSRLFRWYEARCMLRLIAWHSRLRAESPGDGDVLFLDHGPIFKLVRLREFGPTFVRSGVYQEWWNRVFQQWTTMLDWVVWLDAPNSVLLERVQARGTQHRIRQQTTNEAFQFLSLYRSCYEAIIAKWAVDGGPRVLRCNTAHESPHHSVDKIWRTLNA